jgi:hypothetical protein
MKTITFILAAAGFAVAGVAEVHAQSSNSYARVSGPVSLPASYVPQAGFFVGLGGSANSVNFGDQSVFAVGTSNVFRGGAQISSGSAAGPATISMDSQTTFAPSVQGGYFQKFSGSDWLWGAKFSYSYLHATSIVPNALLPQSGSFTATGTNVVTPFIGAALVRSFQTNISQQMMFVPFVGRSFERSFVYAGAGPTLSQLQTNLNGVIGFADINGRLTDVSGAPVNFSSSSWVFGGAAMVGATYFLDRSWFLDFNYSYAMTSNHTASFSSPFTNPNGANGTFTTGTLVGTSAGKVITQAVTASINAAF